MMTVTNLNLKRGRRSNYLTSHTNILNDADAIADNANACVKVKSIDYAQTVCLFIACFECKHVYTWLLICAPPVVTCDLQEQHVTCELFRPYDDQRNLQNTQSVSPILPRPD